MNKKIIALSLVALFLCVGFVSAGMTFQDRVASFTGQFLANNLASQIDVGDLSENIGAVASPDVYSYMKVHGNFWWGASVLATTTTSTTETIAGIDLLNYGYWDVMSNVGNLTYTLPATSTMISILPDIGMSRKWLIHNASSTPTLTIAAGAGMDIVGVAGAEVIDGTEWAELTCTHIYYRDATNENIICIITELER